MSGIAPTSGARDRQDRQVGNQSRQSQIECYLQEDVVSMVNIPLRSNKKQWIEDLHNSPERTKPAAGEGKILDRVQRPAPDLYPAPDGNCTGCRFQRFLCHAIESFTHSMAPVGVWACINAEIK